MKKLRRLAVSWGTSRGLRRSFVALILLGLVVAAGSLYHPSVLIVRPGPTADVSADISISGTWSEPNPGTYLLTTVWTEQPNLFSFFWAQLTAEQVISLQDVVPPGQSMSRYFARQRAIFRESRMFAAAAAAQAVGKDISLEGTGAIVEAVVPDAPTAAVLKAGDVIVEVDDRPIELTSDVQDVVAGLPPGTEVSLSIERGTSQRTLVLRTADLSVDVPERVRSGIGVAITTRDFDIELPFEIEFHGRDIGGPSAGLAYAIAIADMLQPRDYAIETVGATGTINPDGDVGPIGGLPQKAKALEQAGAEIFLVPQRQVDEFEWESSDLELRGVTDLDEALDALYEVVEPAQRRKLHQEAAV